MLALFKTQPGCPEEIKLQELISLVRVYALPKYCGTTNRVKVTCQKVPRHQENLSGSNSSLKEQLAVCDRVL